MGKAEAAMAMVATAPCQAEAYGPGGEGGGGGEEAGVVGGDVAVTKKSDGDDGGAETAVAMWWRWWWRRERVAVKAEVERAACAGREEGRTFGSDGSSRRGTRR